MKHLSILSPIMGTRQDVPNLILSGSFTEDSRNIFLRDGAIENATDPDSYFVVSETETPLPDSDIPLLFHYHWSDDESGQGFLLAFGSTKAYRWYSTGWQAIFTGTNTAISWSAVSYGERVVFSNGVDLVQYYTDGSYSYPIGSSLGIKVSETEFNTYYVTAARVITSFENHLILGGVTLNNQYQPQTLYWNVIGDINDWVNEGAGALDVPGEGFITGFGQFSNFLIIFKQRSIHRMWLTDDDLIFNRAAMSDMIGSDSPHSIKQGPGGELYFMDTGAKIRAMTGVISDFPVLSGPVDKTLRDLPSDLLHKVCSHYSREHDLMIWSVPGTSDSTTNDLLLIHKPMSEQFTLTSLGVSAFGTASNVVGMTIDERPGYIGSKVIYDSTSYICNTSHTSGSTWAEHSDKWTEYTSGDAVVDWAISTDYKEPGLSTAIDSFEYQAGYVPDIVGLYTGYARQLFGSHSSSLTSYFTLATNASPGASLELNKRLFEIELFYKGQSSGTLTIYIKRDNESSWQAAGTVDMTSTNGIASTKIYTNYRSKHFLIKVSSTAEYVFYGLILGFVEDGFR